MLEIIPLVTSIQIPFYLKLQSTINFIAINLLIDGLMIHWKIMFEIGNISG